MVHTPITTTQSQLDFVLLDGSGSMQPHWWDTLSAIDAYVHGLKAARVNSRLLLTTFTNNHAGLEFLTQRDEDVSEWTPLSESPVGASFGSTPLYDAIMEMGRLLRDADPPRAAICIATDGEENGSKFATAEHAKAILDWCRAKGWQVTFIGAEFNNSRLARRLGGQDAEAIGVSMKHLTDATAALAKKRASYGLYGTPMHWTDGEREQFGGYLPDHSNGTGC